MTGSRDHMLNVSMWTIIGIALFFLGLRIYLKWKYGKTISADDYVLSLSWVRILAVSCRPLSKTRQIFLMLNAVFITISTYYGLGDHIQNVPYANIPPALMWGTFGELCIELSLQAGKTSFAMTLLRLVIHRWQKWLLWFIIISLNVVMGLNAIAIFVWCRPVQKIWDWSVPGTCTSPLLVVKVSIGAGAYSGVMDLVMAAFPMVLLWNLRIERREKIGVCVGMSLGVLAGVSAIVRVCIMGMIGKVADVTCKLPGPFCACTLIDS